MMMMNNINVNSSLTYHRLLQATLLPTRVGVYFNAMLLIEIGMVFDGELIAFFFLTFYKTVRFVSLAYQIANRLLEFVIILLCLSQY